ncbi:Hypothetical predicted protein [Mytilus galloprovincialis]|uniref:C1q domain-containing protein n=1 Tax=Mytilus galloprovincialis TaxID=29158 RepID=A0A8B6BI86_MYTGA|nr:Hypothetical predicted protein [Mytilus galloprovincialis]
MAVSIEIVVVLVLCLYGIIHCTNAEEVESIADVKKVLDRVLEEVTHLKFDNSYLRRKQKKLDNSQTELLQEFHNVKTNNHKLQAELQRLSIQNKILNNLVRRQCSGERNDKDQDPYTFTKPDTYTTRILPNTFPANRDIENKHISGKGKSSIDKVRKRLFLNVPTTSIVAFSAVLDHEATLGPLQVVKYNKILTNVGNAYDPRHGHANIPIKGIYLVAVTSMNHNNEEMHIELVRNDDLQGSMYMPAGEQYDSMSQTLVLSLEKNDLVWVRVYNSNTYVGHRLYGTSVEFYNTFSAILLFPL